MTHKVTLELPDRILLKNDSKGNPHYLETKRIKEEVWADILVKGGVNIIMTNTYNSPGAKGTEEERLAAMLKRLDAWYGGSYMAGSVGPRDNIMGDAKKQFLKKNPESKIKQKVEAVLGKDEKATFANYLKAIATELAKAKGSDFHDELEALLVKAQEAAATYRKEEAESLAAIDIDEEVNNMF